MGSGVHYVHLLIYYLWYQEISIMLKATEKAPDLVPALLRGPIFLVNIVIC